MAKRYDRGTLRPPRRLDDGRLIAEGRLTRSGVFEYREPDGKVRVEYRPDGEVFASASMHTFALVPITDDHPPGMLTADTAKEYTVGTIGESIRKDGNYLAATLMVFDAATIAKMEQGKVELSCGYECDVDHTPGMTPDGKRYDAIQRNIRGNHVAIVDVARAGAEARVRMDAATMVHNDNQEQNMDPEQLKKDLDAANQKIADLQKRIDAQDKTSLEAAQKRVDTLQAQLDDANAKLKKLEGERTDASSRFDARVKARVELLNTADRILGATDDAGTRIDRSDVSDRDLKVAIVNHVRGSEDKFDGKSDDYVQARFDAAVEDAGDINDALADVRVAADLGRGKKPGARSDAASARDKMISDNRTAWTRKQA